MLWRIEKFVRQVLHVLRWLPVIWKDQDWDQAWMFTLWAYKLERMQVCHENDPYHGDSKYRYARQLLICKNLLRRLAAGNYHEKGFDDHYEKYPCRLLDDLIENSDGTCTLRERTPAESRSLHRLLKEEEALYQADLDLFWKIFRKKHREWWT